MRLPNYETNISLSKGIRYHANMWFLYLDESGDLGFDFVNKKPSKFFTITILAIEGITNNRLLINTVKKTIRRKLFSKSSKREGKELKGSSTTPEVKKYFYKLVHSLPFALFSISLNKKKVYEKLTKEKSRVYNYVARLVLEKIRLENAKVRIELIIDKSKGKHEIKEFNQYLFRQLEARIDPRVPFHIQHLDSRQHKALQAVDMFSWGFFQKYERQNSEWINLFASKVKFDQTYL